MTTQTKATPISKQVLENQNVGKLTMNLYRGGTISGVLRDAGGLKVGAADIKMKNVSQGNKTKTCKTDDGPKYRGHYKIESMARLGDKIEVNVQWSVPPGGAPNVSFKGTVIMWPVRSDE